MGKQDIYNELISDVRAVVSGVHDPIANMANVSACIFDALADVNWVGFYRLIDNTLILGPFQGKPACVSIALGSGVCGTAVSQDKSVLVADVHAFPGHIACDAASRSEIVIPIHHEGKVVAVLDIDSPSVNRFDHLDKQYLEIVADYLGY